MSESPTLGKIVRRNGIAGQFQYTVQVTYRSESMSVVTFVSSIYGHDVIMVTPSGHQVPVRDPRRCGSKLNPDWIRAFFAPRKVEQ